MNGSVFSNLETAHIVKCVCVCVCGFKDWSPETHRSDWSHVHWVTSNSSEARDLQLIS